MFTFSNHDAKRNGTIGLDLKPGQSVLIRGGTSSVGLAAAALATWRGATVLSTTRRAAASLC